MKHIEIKLIITMSVEVRTYCFFDSESAIIHCHAVVVRSVRQYALVVPPIADIIALILEST
jgi:hypothetical protein